MNTTQEDLNETFENSIVPDRQNGTQKMLCSLFSIDTHLPKLNVAGSIPVSRSKNQQFSSSPKKSNRLNKAQSEPTHSVLVFDEGMQIATSSFPL